jgi:hypothetical protein
MRGFPFLPAQARLEQLKILRPNREQGGESSSERERH